MVTALHEGVPVIAITSQHRSGIAYPSTPATFQGQDQLDLFRPCCEVECADLRVDAHPRDRAHGCVREMWAGRPGPDPTGSARGPSCTRNRPVDAAPIFPAESWPREPSLQASAAQIEEAAALLAGGQLHR